MANHFDDDARERPLRAAGLPGQAPTRRLRGAL